MLCFASDTGTCRGSATHVWAVDNVRTAVCDVHARAAISNAATYGGKVRKLGGRK